ncbi:MAG: AMP-binding protein, partial [Vulcanimicrobiaceae bacterium]
THDGPQLTFSDVNRSTNRIAWGLLQRGVRKGQRIAILMKNSLAHVYVWLACAKIGAVDVPINVSYKGEFLKHQLNQCRASILVADTDVLDSVSAIAPDLSWLQTVIVYGDEPNRELSCQLGGRFELHRYEKLDAHREGNPGVEVAPWEPASVMFTSGTTGLSKGAILSHAHLYFFSEQTLQLHELGPDDVYLNPFPLFHGSGRVHGVYPSLIAGCRCVLYEKFSARQFLDRAYGSGGTVSNLLGGMIPLLSDLPPTSRDRGHSLRSILATPVPYSIVDGFKERYEIADVLEVIGMTETCWPIITPRNSRPPKGAAGLLAAEWYETKIADPETDEEVAVGQVGELLVRNRIPWTISLGYENMPDQTVETWRNLWFHTGDAVKRDADGWYYFVDRIKDSIRRRGESVSSFEVERQLLAHPQIADAAVVAVRPDAAINDDEIKAYIIPSAEADLDLSVLVKWCESRLPHFAVPRYYEFVTELPKTPTGKVRKAVLREKGLNGKTWDRLSAGVLLSRESASRS